MSRRQPMAVTDPFQPTPFLAVEWTKAAKRLEASGGGDVGRAIRTA